MCLFERASLIITMHNMISSKVFVAEHAPPSDFIGFALVVGSLHQVLTQDYCHEIPFVTISHYQVAIYIYIYTEPCNPPILYTIRPAYLLAHPATTTMSPIQATPTTPAHTPGPDPWRIAAIILITTSILSLLAGGAALLHLHRSKTRLSAIASGPQRTRAAPNPHPFGSHAWRERELASVPSTALDALHIADLEAQNSLLEQRAEALEGLVDLCEGRNERLRRENAELRLGSGLGLDEEAMRRVVEELHRPVRRPGGRGPGFERQGVTGLDGDSKVRVGFVAALGGAGSADGSDNPGGEVRRDPAGLELPLVPSIFTDCGRGEFIGSSEEMDLLAPHVADYFCDRRQSGSSEGSLDDIELCEYWVSGQHSPSRG